MKKQGLYDPRNEHDNCGVGFVADIHGIATHKIIQDGLAVLKICDDLYKSDGENIIIQD